MMKYILLTILSQFDMLYIIFIIADIVAKWQISFFEWLPAFGFVERENMHLVSVDKEWRPERKVSARRRVYPALKKALSAAVIVV